MPGQPTERFTAAAGLELALTKISWNVATRRLLDEFAANALREHRLFLDHGYSHPNFELRFVVMNYRLSPSETGRALLRPPDEVMCRVVSVVSFALLLPLYRPLLSRSRLS